MKTAKLLHKRTGKDNVPYVELLTIDLDAPHWKGANLVWNEEMGAFEERIGW